MTYKEAFTKLVEQIRSIYVEPFDWDRGGHHQFDNHNARTDLCEELINYADDLKQSVGE